MNESFTFAEKDIDNTLRRVGGVEPRFGFEQRLLTRVAAATPPFPVSGGRLAGVWRLRRGVKIGGMLLAASIAGAAVLVGSATHKVPGRPLPVQQSPVSRGFGAASGEHVPSRVLGPSENGLGPRGRGRGRAGQGRAKFHSSPTHRTLGTAAPDSPYPHPE